MKNRVDFFSRQNAFFMNIAVRRVFVDPVAGQKSSFL
jgi:hypothetical protein